MTFRSLATADGATWTLRATAGPIDSTVAGREVAASVPGEVQLDLLAAGLIADPYDGANEQVQEWIGYTDWQYRTVFPWSSTGDARHDLVADGLDTAATLTLNGTIVGNTRNQHRGYRFDIGSLLVDGDNELVVDFRSPIEFAREQELLLGELPTVMHHPFNAVRKMACNFGWDWGIDVSSSGIWKSIGIESWSGVRIASVRPLVDVLSIDGTRGSGVLNAHVALEWADAASTAQLEVTVNDQSITVAVDATQHDVSVAINAGTVALWWPRGYGEQALYPVAVSAGGARWNARVGFRTVGLDTDPDEHGTPFNISVNRQLINIRGANWIPGDTFVTRVTPEKYRTAIGEAVSANMNMLRIWGGGIYEQDAFYDACDEAGVLVWQDFLFACAAYAEEDPLRGEVEAEARENVTRLSSHASLVLWNGCNENLWGYVEWDWRRTIGDRTWGEGYYVDLLPSIVAELDPTRPYSPGSPFSFTRYAHPNDPRHGTMHIWDVWNELDYTEYADKHPRFASEFGFQGPPAWTTLTDAVHDEPLDPYGTQMLVHQKADEGNLKLERGLGEHLPTWRSIEEWHWATQLNQARAIRFGIEHFRSLYPRTTGSLVWQLNDSWPVISWAAVDYNGNRKPLWQALRRAYTDRLLTVQPRDGVPVLIAHNDSGEEWAEQVSIRRMTTDGELLASQVVSLGVPARGIVELALDDTLATPADPSKEFLVAESGVTDNGFWYFVEDTELVLAAPADALSTSVEVDGDVARLTVTASALVKDLTVQADRITRGAAADSGLVTLLPGGAHTFVITGMTGGLDPAVVGRFPVLCSANDLVTG